MNDTIHELVEVVELDFESKSVKIQALLVSGGQKNQFLKEYRESLDFGSFRDYYWRE